MEVCANMPFAKENFSTLLDFTALPFLLNGNALKNITLLVAGILSQSSEGCMQGTYRLLQALLPLGIALLKHNISVRDHSCSYDGVETSLNAILPTVGRYNPLRRS